ncbi:MAG TPA: o-succinylbenzoate synthase [Edaphobacter sp.]|nr:o-succinylbenzoate synthase [Edaphobacter sp.]
MNTCLSSEELGTRGPITFRNAEAWRVSIPMLEPFRISSGEVSRKDAIILRLSDGHNSGWGESSAMPGAFYSSETPDTCERELVDRILPELSGRTFPTMLEFEAALAELTSSRFVRVAIETAAWELLARQAGQSLREFFGIPNRSVPSGLAVGLYDTDEELHSALERYHVHDYHRLKIKIKRGHDVQLVHAVRKWYEDIPLFVDANADYSLNDLDTFRSLDSYGLMMFEQPFSRQDFEGSAALQKAVKTPICFDESIETAADVQHAAELDACQIVNIKLQRVGGYLEAFRIAECCMKHNIALWLGTMPELGIGSAQAIMFAAHPGCIYPTDVEPSTRWYQDDILQQTIALQGNELTMPSGPGLGFTVNMDKLERYALRHWSF